MTESFVLNHAARVLASVQPGHPADQVLRHYLSGGQRMGPAERRAVSKAVFCYYRWRSWLEERSSLQTRISQALALAARFEADPKSVKPEALAALAVPAWLKAEASFPVESLLQLQREPALWLRARPGTGAHLAAELGECEASAACSDALRYRGGLDLFLTPQFKTGAFEIQDLASQAVGLCAAPNPGELWWDACAGEGGKTLHLADLMKNRGLVWASDRSAGRLEVLKRRAARAKLFNYRTVLWDGSAKLPVRSRFDGVLLDAPCSGVGTWQRNPHARWSATPQDVAELAVIQAALLEAVAPAVGPGGRLVYAVCTVTQRETAGVAAAFSAAHPEFEPAACLPPECRPASGAVEGPGSVLLWPHALGGNGMFIAAWKKKS